MRRPLSPRSRRLRAVLIPLNFLFAAAMFITLVFGIFPQTATAICLTIVTAASIIAVLIER